MSIIEVGTGERVRAGEIGAAEIKQQHAEKKAKAAPIAKQRAGNRAKAKGTEGIYSVDHDDGTRRPQNASSVTIVDHGPKTNWQRAYSLPSFPDPPGYSYCWIARHKRRHGDDVGLLASLREGWVPVKPDELDEQDVPTESFTGRLAKHGEVVGDETTILCKISDRMKAQRDAYFNKKRDAATREVRRSKPGIPEANSKMPLVEDRNEISEDLNSMRARRAPRPDSDP